MTVRLFVEGGGNDNPLLKRACREGFSKFLARAGFAGRMPRIVACGSRNDAFDSFRTACHQGLPSILLVDSEEPLRHEFPARHLSLRDSWEFDDHMDSAGVHLMIQCMENWFLADIPALARFYGQGFQTNALPTSPLIESVGKRAVFAGLEQATRNTKTKGSYSKGKHSFAILAMIDPNKLRSAGPYVDRLLTHLDQVMAR